MSNSHRQSGSEGEEAHPARLSGLRLNAVRTEGSDASKGSTVPAPWSHDTGQAAHLAPVFEPPSHRRSGPRTRPVQEACKPFQKDRSGRDRPRREHRGRRRENASDRDSRSARCSQKAAERRRRDLASLLELFYKKKKTKTASTCYSNSHDVKVPPARQTIDVRALNLTHTTNYSIKVKGRGGKGKTYFLPPPKRHLRSSFCSFLENSHIQRLA